MVKEKTKLGIIKGGQLGKMLLEEVGEFDLSAFVLDSDPDCPCRSLADFTVGDCLSFDDVYAFGQKIDVLTFEYEHINTEALKKLKNEGVVVHPDPSIIELVQNKAVQKEFYVKHNIPTADFVLVPDKQSIDKYKHLLPVVQKTTQAGYDGKGVYKISSQADMQDALEGPSILEKWIDFDKEISVLLARSADGKIAVYPTVEMVFHPQKNLVEFLSCPAAISKDIEDKARQIALGIAEQIGLVGVLAVEMFVDKKGNVFVNEIAPRVHNSGHHTIEGSLTSQFKQHLRAVLGFSLGPTDLTRPSVMVNILGSEGHEGPAIYEGIDEAIALGGVYVHLYGKAITKPFRKMGHATILDKNINEAFKKAQAVKRIIKVRT